MSAARDRIAANRDEVLRRIGAACARADRDPRAVRLVAVTKYARLEWVRDLIALGVSDLGEGRPQQLDERAGLIDRPVCWHLVGPLQRNKARRTLAVAEWIHSIDSLRLLQRIDELAAEMRIRPRLLLEVNIAGEAQKHGFCAEDLMELWERIIACRNAEIAGLMTMAPYEAPPDEIRRVFRHLRGLRDELAARADSLPLPELSMGMSGDFEIAIEEGATMVRIGSLLFEGLDAGLIS